MSLLMTPWWKAEGYESGVLPSTGAQAARTWHSYTLCTFSRRLVMLYSDGPLISFGRKAALRVKNSVIDSEINAPYTVYRR